MEVRHRRSVLDFAGIAAKAATRVPGTRRSSTSSWSGGWPKRRWLARRGPSRPVAPIPLSAPGQRGPRRRPDLALCRHEPLRGPARRLRSSAARSGARRLPACGRRRARPDRDPDRPGRASSTSHRSLLGWTHAGHGPEAGRLLEADGIVLTERPVVHARSSSSRALEARLRGRVLAGCALEVGPPAVASFDADLDGVEGIRRISARRGDFGCVSSFGRTCTS